MTCIPTDPAYSLAWSSDSRRLFAGCHWWSILCFDVERSGSTPAMSKWPRYPHFDSISSLSLSNNGKLIISASCLGFCIKIWDVHTRSELGSLSTSEILDAELSPGDGYIVSDTEDGKIFLWDIQEVLLTPFFFHVSLDICVTDHLVLIMVLLPLSL